MSFNVLFYTYINYSSALYANMETFFKNNKYQNLCRKYCMALVLVVRMHLF